MPLDIAVGPRAKRESVAVATGVDETKKLVFAAFWNANELPRADPEVQSGSAWAMPWELVVTVPEPQVTERVIEPVLLPPFVTQPEPVKEVTPVFVRVLPEKMRPVPIDGVVSFPFASTESNEEVEIAAKMVDELKVVVELCVAPPLKVCRPVQVTLEAAVTKPGFTNERVVDAVPVVIVSKPPA